MPDFGMNRFVDNSVQFDANSVMNMPSLIQSYSVNSKESARQIAPSETRSYLLLDQVN